MSPLALSSELHLTRGQPSSVRALWNGIPTIRPININSSPLFFRTTLSAVVVLRQARPSKELELCN